ncbi:MAG: hypothetical protein IJQ46_02945, partial [Oscillospiraceae bacterium]|nr:hypothetical protein [Oscillospiraceae bacterium]
MEFVFKSLQMPTKYPRLTAEASFFTSRRDFPLTNATCHWHVAPKPGPIGGRPLEFVFKSLQMPTKDLHLTVEVF